jgi:hypothetical protein
VTEIARKKRRVANKSAARAIVGVSLEVINKRRAEKPEVRQGRAHCAQPVCSNAVLLCIKAAPGIVPFNWGTLPQRSHHASCHSLLHSHLLSCTGLCMLMGRVVCASSMRSPPPCLPLRPPLCPCACLSPQFRQANRDKAIREVKERAKKMKADKAKASKAGAGAKAAPAAKVVGRGKR